MVIEVLVMIGVLVAVAVYLLLQPTFVRILFGFLLLSNAANLFLLVMSGPPDQRRAPIVQSPDHLMVDPLPQALILTAIVIGFGVTAYLILLMYRLFLDQRTTRVDKMYEETPSGGSS